MAVFMGFEEISEYAQAFFMIVGLLIVLPPIFLVKFIKFLKE